MSFDSGLYEDVTDFAQSVGWLAGPAEVFSEYGVVLVAPVILALLWRARRRSAAELAAAVWVPVAIGVALVFDTVLKYAFAEVRPCRVVPGAHPLLPCDPPADYAFPSNHTVIAAAFAAAVLLVHRRWGWWSMAFAVLVAISRVYTGAHYPHDVVAGLAVGAGVGLLGLAVIPRLAELAGRFRDHRRASARSAPRRGRGRPGFGSRPPGGTDLR
ncbi:phosphatase PAP2 family protein [Amycolatopsis sp. PS_44_ISF1]|uniref:phosphatase PAP2 family protein n=1 Tax=Amycolatopsis sp. PS_44_ISF1 TaxID=2974917 RepID=UPI0028DF2C42|nr:phosphatase PAP2 family protein [Amycolatopsis sp. PS_44_ISF1]MDT8913043.1 phosphatase PAP2 family protein [Amycolatopsis sp. PS_44_ISF1]